MRLMLQPASDTPNGPKDPVAASPSASKTIGTPEAGSTAPLTAEEAALAERLSQVLAGGVKRGGKPDLPRRHVRLSAEPEDVIVAPPVPSEGDFALPPPLPDVRAPASFDDPGRGEPPSSTSAAITSAVPPWLAPRRRLWRSRAPTALAWTVTLLVTASLFAIAALGLVGVERVTRLLLDAVEIIGDAMAWISDRMSGMFPL